MAVLGGIGDEDEAGDFDGFDEGWDHFLHFGHRSISEMARFLDVEEFIKGQ